MGQTFEEWEIPEDIDDEKPGWIFPRDFKNKEIEVTLEKTAQYNSSRGEPFPVLLAVSKDGMTKKVVSLLGQTDLMKSIKKIHLEKGSIKNQPVKLSADKEGKKWRVV